MLADAVNGLVDKRLDAQRQHLASWIENAERYRLRPAAERLPASAARMKILMFSSEIMWATIYRMIRKIFPKSV
jgi:hypothetical protein